MLQYLNVHKKKINNQLLILNDNVEMKKQRNIKITTLNTPPPPNTTTLEFCVNIHKHIFNATYRKCASSECCTPKEQMLFCHICRDWYHKTCANDKNKKIDKKYTGPACLGKAPLQ